MLEAKAKDQGHKAQVLSKKKKKKKGLHKNFSGDLQKKKKRSSQKFFKRSPRNNAFQKIFQPLHKILTFQKIVLSSSRGQADFRGLEASRPRPRPRTSKPVLEDSTSGNTSFHVCSHFTIFARNNVQIKPNPSKTFEHPKSDNNIFSSINHTKFSYKPIWRVHCAASSMSKRRVAIEVNRQDL